MNLMIRKAHEIDGWMSHHELLWLAEQASYCTVVIECGCYKGRSTVILADNCLGFVIAVDPFSGNYYNDDNTVMKYIGDNILREFEHNLRHHLDSRRVIHIRSQFHELDTAFRPDMIFIDGDHRYEQTKRDILHAKELLKSGGILSGHDYGHPDWPGVREAVDECVGKVELCESIWSRII